MNKQSKRLIWIDLEMTGLDTQTDTIIEIATVVTKPNLEIVAEGPNLAIHQSDSVLDKMDNWNKTQHEKSGLINRVRNSNISLKDAEDMTLEFLQNSPIKANVQCVGTVFVKIADFLQD